MPCAAKRTLTFAAQAAAHKAGLDACATPGLLAASLFPAIIGSRLVRSCQWCVFLSQACVDSRFSRVGQPGALYLSQSLSFRKAAPVGAQLHATVRVVKLSGSRAQFETRCVLEGSQTVIADGVALALLKGRAG